MNDSQTCVNFVSEVEGSFDVLIIGTRKDKAVSNAYQGVELVNDKSYDIVLHH
jgi:thiamine pyrophosphokinase